MTYSTTFSLIIVTFLTITSGDCNSDTCTTASSAEECDQTLNFTALYVEDLRHVLNFNDIKMEDLNVTSKIGDRIPANQAKNVLIVSTWRSGSNLLSALLSMYPGAWYWTEPLHYLEHGKQLPVDEFKEEETTPLLSDLFSCNMSEELRSYGRQTAFTPEINFNVWSSCNDRRKLGDLCLESGLSNQVCQLHPIRISKTVRFRLKTAKKLLNDPNLGQSLKVIYLVRDPRAIINSRDDKLVRSWCNKPYCNDGKVLCKNQVEDYYAAKEMLNLYPKTVKVLRYEDFALNPHLEMENVLKFLTLPIIGKVTKLVETFSGVKRDQEPLKVLKHDDLHKAGRESRSRQFEWVRSSSSASAFSWINSMSVKKLNMLQKVCKKAMSLFGYITISKKEVQDKNINVNNVLFSHFKL